MDLVKAQSITDALKLIAALNHDNGYNYPYTQYQLNVIAEHVAELSAQGAVFTDALVDSIIGGPMADEEFNYEPYEALGELLDDIFNGVDENGTRFPLSVSQDPDRNAFHFNATPYPVGAKRPW
jgi:hypothetical protein